MGKHGVWNAIVIVGLMGIGIIRPAFAEESLALITELKPGRGRVEVQRAETGQWQPAAPLLSLKHRDAVRATGDASAVLIFSDGRGSVRVTTVNSPLTVEAKSRTESKLQKALTLLQESVEFLKARKPETFVRLGTRAASDVLLLVSPKETSVLPGGLTFEWRGATTAGYTIRVLGPSGLIFERPNLPRPLFRYPADAPHLSAGVQHTWQIQAGNVMREAWFQVVDEQAARTVHEELGALEQATEVMPPNTAAALKVALLAQRGLDYDARHVLLEAIRRDPDEPTLHRLLGDLYARAGLSVLAAEAYRETEHLSR